MVFSRKSSFEHWHRHGHMLLALARVHALSTGTETGFVTVVGTDTYIVTGTLTGIGIASAYFQSEFLSPEQSFS